MTTEKTKGGGDIERSFTTLFSLTDGKSPDQSSTKRHLADVKQMFVDTVEAERILEKENPLVYEFYELGIPSDPGDLAFGTSITYPGQVAGEYYKTIETQGFRKLVVEKEGKPDIIDNPSWN